MPISYKGLIVDLSHNDKITLGAFTDMKKAGIAGVILKASEGAHWQDPNYHEWVVRARSTGMLVGHYHFGTNVDSSLQFDNFVEAVGDFNDDDLYVLDWESAGSTNTMTKSQAENFIGRLRTAIGRKPCIYSGEAFWNSHCDGVSPCKMWIAKYSSRKPVIAQGTVGLWQFTGDGQGPMPHSCPGVKGNAVDLSRYMGKMPIKEWWCA